VSVCLSVRDHIFGTTRPIFNKVTYDRGSVLLWRCSDRHTSRISGFMDDVIFAHKPRLLEVAAVLGMVRKYTCCKQRTLGTTFVVRVY